MANEVLVSHDEAMNALIKQGKTVYRKAWNHSKLVKYIPQSSEEFENIVVDWCGIKGTWVPCVADSTNADWIIEG